MPKKEAPKLDAAQRLARIEFTIAEAEADFDLAKKNHKARIEELLNQRREMAHAIVTGQGDMFD